MVIPKKINSVIKKGCVLAVIQFGSSIRKTNYHDIDLAVVIRCGFYEKFLRDVYGNNFHGFDIALIKEEEIQDAFKFRWGNHGAHMLKSLIQGRVIYGANPFLGFYVSDEQIKGSVISRLYGYMEDVRRAVFEGNINKDIKRRWPKFLRLCLYLLDPKLTYPEVLGLENNELLAYLKKNQININTKDLLIAYEKVWEKVFKKYKGGCVSYTHPPFEATAV